MVTGSLALSIGMTSAVLVVPILSNPVAAKPYPVETHATALRLGDVDRPAAGVTRRSGLPAGATLGADVAAQLRGATSLRAAAAAAPRTITVRRDSTSAFSAVGVTWANDPSVTAVSVAVRAKDTAGKWGAWSSADSEENDRGQAGNTPRTGSGMIWTGPARGVEVAVSAVAGTAPRDVRVDLIDPGASPADRSPEAGAPLAKANAATAMPKIYTRAAWGADPKKMTWKPSYAPTIKAVTLHHTVNSNTYTRDQVPAMLRAIYQYHSVSNGWGDVGYNVIVDRFGRLWEGRYGGLSRAVGGAHAGGFNWETAGISMLGTYTSAPVPSAVREAVARYAAWKLSLYNVNPTGSTKLTGGQNSKYKGIVTVTVPRIFPHRTTSLTACPGQGGMDALPWIRTRAGQLFRAAPKPAPKPTPTPTPTPKPTPTPTPKLTAQLTTFDGTTGTWNILGSAPVKFGAAGDVAQPGEWTGDGKADLAVFRPSTGEWLVRGGTTVRWGTPGKGDVPVAGKYLRTDRLGPAIYRTSTRTWYVKGATSTSHVIVKYGNNGDIPVPADYNGDGKTDIAVFNTKTGKWSIKGAGSVVFGTKGDVPVPADYDGDGQAELAVFRPSTGQWVFQTGTKIGWGTPGKGDVPLPGRYDADKKADLAIWRRSTATFHIRRVIVTPLGSSKSTPVLFR
jgi:hypothetical protein